MKRKIALSVLFVVLFCIIFLIYYSSSAHANSDIVWKDKFELLSPGMSRLEAENEIEKIRGIKSTYDLYAMDTSPWVAYSLDQKTILLVRYEPGAPAPIVLDTDGNNIHLEPIDGRLIEYEILQLK